MDEEEDRKGCLAINGDYFSISKLLTRYSNFYNNTNDKVYNTIQKKSFRNMHNIINKDRLNNRNSSISFTSRRKRLNNFSHTVTDFTKVNDFEFQLNKRVTPCPAIHNLNSTSNYFNTQLKNQKFKSQHYKVSPQLQLPSNNETTSIAINTEEPNYTAYTSSTPLPKAILPFQSDSLYTILNKRKNDFFCEQGHSHPIPGVRDVKNYKFKKCLQIQTMSNYSTTSKKDDLIGPRARQFVPTLHDLQCSNVSEKKRYEVLIKKLYKLRQIIENAPKDKELFIIKEFLMNNGIYEPEYYEIDKLNNFSTFIHGELKLNLSLSAKEIIINALLFGNNYETINSKSTQYCTVKTNKTRKDIDKGGKGVKSRNDNKVILDIQNDLELQSMMNNRTSPKFVREFDIINNPKEIVDYLKHEFEEDNDMLFGDDDTCNSGMNYYNERLYGTKRLKSDYNVLVKKNKLTDYVCLLKAKNMYEVNQLKKRSIMPKKKR